MTVINKFKDAAQKAKYTAKSAYYLTKVVNIIRKCPNEMRQIRKLDRAIKKKEGGSQAEMAKAGLDTILPMLCEDCQKKIKAMIPDLDGELT